jgi:hypothetical protein
MFRSSPPSTRSVILWRLTSRGVLGSARGHQCNVMLLEFCWMGRAGVASEFLQGGGGKAQQASRGGSAAGKTDTGRGLSAHCDQSCACWLEGAAGAQVEPHILCLGSLSVGDLIHCRQASRIHSRLRVATDADSNPGCFEQVDLCKGLCRSPLVQPSLWSLRVSRTSPWQLYLSWSGRVAWNAPALRKQQPLVHIPRLARG